MDGVKHRPVDTSTVTVPSSDLPATPTPSTIVEAAPSATCVPEEADSYDKHEPRRGRVGRFVARQLDKVAPIRTHERVMTEVRGSVLGFDVGITVSQLDLLKKDVKGIEIVQVVNADGSSNVETILGRKHLSHNQRIELQGPALNTSVTPGELPLGARFVGVGLTSDLTSAMDHDAASYTVEVKITERSLLEWAALGGPGAAAIASSALSDVASAGAASVVSELILGAVPVLSAVLAVSSARRAVHVVRDPTAKKAMKVFAVLHALGDAVRVFFPLIGTLGNVALVGVAATQGWLHHRHAKHAPPTGPPVEPPAQEKATPVPETPDSKVP